MRAGRHASHRAGRHASHGAMTGMSSRLAHMSLLLHRLLHIVCSNFNISLPSCIRATHLAKIAVRSLSQAHHADCQAKRSYNCKHKARRQTTCCNARAKYTCMACRMDLLAMTCQQADCMSRCKTLVYLRRFPPCVLQAGGWHSCACCSAPSWPSPSSVPPSATRPSSLPSG